MWPWSMIPTRSASTSRLLEVLRRQEHGDHAVAVAREPNHLLPERALRLCGSSPVVRLVEEEDSWPVDECERKIQPALHAAGVALHLPVCRLGEADPFKQLVRALSPIPARQRAGAPRLQPQVLPAGQQRVERGFLQRGADRRRAPRGLP